VETKTNNTSTGAFAWAPIAAGALCVSPITQRQGTALPFAAEYAAVPAGLSVATGMTAHTGDDAKVPDPRGRKR
jgi:hypothetical protein